MASNILTENTKLKNIFETMEYGSIPEGYDLALAWLTKRNNRFCVRDAANENFSTIKPNIKEDLLIKIISSSNDDVEQLIQKSETQLQAWSSASGRQRSKLLISFATEIARHTTLICQLEMIIRNILPKDTKNKSLPVLADYFRYYAGLAYLFEKQFSDDKSYGTCACILSDDTPLAVLSLIIAPVLASENTIIIQTSSNLTPLVFLLSEICENVGYPEGVMNVVMSNTDVLLNHKNIRKIICVGDLLNDFFININISMEKSLTTLQLGKAAMVIFDNADLDSACDSIPDAVWSCNGKLPWSVNKLYVQETIFQKFIDKVEVKLEKLNVGLTAQDKMLDIIIPKVREPKNSKFKLVNNLPLIIGYKVFGSNVISPEENNNILTVSSFRTANEVANLVNNNRFGFAASVWTENIGLANEMTSKLKVGIVWINIHGYINANATFSPYKESGSGNFGGKDGVKEYLLHKNVCEFIKLSATKTKLESLLPNPVTNKGTYLFYGGAFRKSESGLIDSVYEFPDRKDIRNCVEIAKKGCESWSKLQAKVRGQYLLKLADASASVKVPNSVTSENWIELLHEWIYFCESIESLVQDGRPNLKVLMEPLGIIAIDSCGETDILCLKLIVAALATGSAIIIVNNCNEGQLFLSEICKIVSVSGIPAGIFNVISNPNTAIYNTLTNHREVQAYYTFNIDNNIKLPARQRIKNIQNMNLDSNSSILNLVMKRKCIWTNAAESIL